MSAMVVPPGFSSASIRPRMASRPGLASLRLLGLLSLMALLGISSIAQRGAVTRQRSLDQMVDEADVIVQGSVISAKVEPHPQLKNLMTVLITMHVTETLKGNAAKAFQFRQYIWDIRDQIDSARYAKGQELILLLSPESQYGLRSPIGLEQGRFRIQYDKSGQAQAMNGRGNAALFEATGERAKAQGRKLSTQVSHLVQQPSGGPIAAIDLKAAIRSFMGAAK